MEKDNNKLHKDILIIGGGASGLAASIVAKRTNPKASVLVLEKKGLPGKKLRATGNGKCNLSNVNCRNCRQVLDFFLSLGIVTREDKEGRIYPYNEEAADLADNLIESAKKTGVEFICDADVRNLEFADWEENDYPLKVTVNAIFKSPSSKGRNSENKLSEKIFNVFAKKVLIATGGKSYPEFGTTGDGYIFARKLGHTLSPLAPSLSPVETRENLKDIAGVRAKSRISLEYKGENIFEEEGEIQFTNYGISGICVFNLSQYLEIPKGTFFESGFKDYEINIDFLPEFSIEEIRKLLLSQINPMASLVKKKIAHKIEDISSIDLSSVTDKNVDKIIMHLKKFTLHCKGVKGWKTAQVTRGGVVLEEVDMETMESKILPGIYFSGEVLDYCGSCGGFNLQNAWETGIRAGKAMAADLIF